MNKVSRDWLIKDLPSDHPARAEIKKFAKANRLTVAGAIIVLANKIKA
jgi:hypothetical protein